MNTLLQDLRYGLRQLARNPGFSAVALLTLAVGIGANTAIFTVVDAALLRGLPYHNAEELFHLWELVAREDFPQREASFPDFLDWQQNPFLELAHYNRGGVTLVREDWPMLLQAGRGSANFFSVLGVEPLHGRLFEPGEDTEGRQNVAVLSYALWQGLFGGDPAVLGTTLRIGGDAATVVGVLPRSFHFALADDAQLWLPNPPSEAKLTRRFMHGTNVIARLRPGATREQAEAEAEAIGRRIVDQFPDSHAGTGVALVPLQEQIVGDVRPLLGLLMAAVGFVLLIACANVANLFLVRSAAREKEMAIRTTLGAGRWRLTRQLLTESVVLAGMGGALGLLLAQWGVDALISAIPQSRLDSMPYLRDLGIDGGVLAFTACLTLLTGVLFGLAPAFQLRDSSLNDALRDGGRSSGGRIRPGLRSALVAAEMALALVLLVGAGLILQSLERLLRVDPGFSLDNLLTFRVALPASGYQEPEERLQFHRALLERLESLPGVRGAATTDRIPLLSGNTTRLIVAGEPAPPPGQELEANLRNASANYFQVLGAPLIRGRFFDERDTADKPLVLIVNQTLATRLFGSRDPVGRSVLFASMNAPAVEVVGLVGDIKAGDLDTTNRPVVYYPYTQGPDRDTGVLVRTAGDPSALAPALREQCQTLEPGAVFYELRTMQSVVADSPATFLRRYPALLTGLFAGIALLLAAVGLFGVISYAVGRQTHDIGVRLALGARGSDIIKMMLRQWVGLIGAGLAAGMVAALLLTRLLESLLFEVSATDPMTFIAAAAVLCLAALLASVLPALRAARVDPLVALRYE